MTRDRKKQSVRGLSRLEVLLALTLIVVVVALVVVVPDWTGSSTEAHPAFSDAGLEVSNPMRSPRSPRPTGEGGAASTDTVGGVPPAVGMMDGEAGWARGTQSVESSDLQAPDDVLVVLHRMLEADRPDQRQILRLIDRLPPGRVQEAWALVVSMPWSPDRDEVQTALMSRWASEDPEGALVFVEESVDSRRQRSIALRAIIKTWVEADPLTVSEWYTEDKAHRKLVRNADVGLLFSSAFAENPEDAMRNLWKLPRYGDRMRVLSALFSKESPQGYEQALGVYEGAPDAEGRKALAVTIARLWATVNPAGAGEWASGLDDQEAQRHAMHTLAGAWGRVSPEEAVVWLQGMPSSTAKKEAMTHLIRGWSYDNPEGLLEWAEAQPGSGVKEMALAGAARSLGHREPSRAMQMASELADDQTRFEVMDSVARHWMRVDRSAAIIYVLGSDLPDPIKRKYAQQGLSALKQGHAAP